MNAAQIKNILCDIIDYAYPDDEKKENYKNFSIKLLKKENRTLNGYYTYKGNSIRIMNPSNGNELNFKTCIHELSHHVDWCNRGCSGHGKEFYQHYRELLYAGLNMRLFTKEDFMTEKDRSNDRNKVQKILDEWEPAYVDYKKTEIGNTGKLPMDVLLKFSNWKRE